MIALSFALLLAAGPAQDDLDASIKDLANKISKEGISGRLAEAAAADWGVQAIKERIDFLMGARTARFERDPMGYYEDHLFAVDGKGDLRLYPQHQDEMKRLAARMSRAADCMKDFHRRCDDLVKRLDTSTDFNKRARQYWEDPSFRVAFFHRHTAEFRELRQDDLAWTILLRSLQPARDGKLYLAGPYADELRSRMDSTYGMLEALKNYEKAYLQEAAKVKDAAARGVVTSDPGILFILGRLLRQAAEGGDQAIGGITEGDENKPPIVSFNLDLEELAPLVTQAEKTAAELKAIFDQAIPEIAPSAEGEINVLEFLKNDRARILLAERVMAMRQDQQKKADEIMATVFADGFEEKDGKLHVKKGRYVDDNKEESLDALSGELNGVIEEFNGTLRQDFDRVAERCIEPSVIAMFEDRTATFLLVEHRDHVVATLVEATKKQGLEVFMKTYLAKDGDAYIVRPERAKKVEAILQRATDIKKEMEKAAEKQ